MEVDRGSLVEGADVKLGGLYPRKLWNLLRLFSDDSIKPQNNLTFSSIVIGIGRSIWVLVQQCVASKCPNLCIDRAKVSIKSLAKRRYPDRWFRTENWYRGLSEPLLTVLALKARAQQSDDHGRKKRCFLYHLLSFPHDCPALSIRI